LELSIFTSLTKLSSFLLEKYETYMNEVKFKNVHEK